MRVDQEGCSSPVSAQVLTSKLAWRILGERKKQRLAQAVQNQRVSVGLDSRSRTSSESWEGDRPQTSTSSSSVEGDSPRGLSRSWRPVELQVHHLEAELHSEDDAQESEAISPAGKTRHSPACRWHRFRARVSPCSFSPTRAMDHIQADISRMNKLITLQSVADKADENWKLGKVSPEIRQTESFKTVEQFRQTPSMPRRASQESSASSSDNSSRVSSSQEHNAMWGLRKNSEEPASLRTSLRGAPSHELSPQERKAIFRELITTPPRPDSETAPHLARFQSTPEILTAPADVTASQQQQQQRLSRSRMRRWSATMYDPSLRRSSLQSLRGASSESRRALDSAAVGSDLSTLAAGIPAGDPRIGELYAAAARSFGGISFISSASSLKHGA